MFRPECDSIIFDLDGTLWDSSAATAAGWTRVSQELGINLLVDEEAVRKVSGLPFERCVEILFGDKTQDLGELKVKLSESEKVEVLATKGRLYPGVDAGLRTLSSKYKLFLVSNCQDWYLKAFLQQSGLQGLFQDSLCFGQTQKSKTENIRLVVERNKLKKAIYVGDTHWDQEAAYHAGVKFLFAAYGFGKPNISCPSVQSFDELVALMMKPVTVPDIICRNLQETEFDSANHFYKSVGYIQSTQKYDKFFAAFYDQQMIGLVRLALENGILVLRGMQIRADYQFLGIGTKLIRLLEKELGNQKCFCIPHGWLEKFYSQIGFSKIENMDLAPLFLKDRFKDNQKKYPHLILMMRNA